MIDVTQVSKRCLKMGFQRHAASNRRPASPLSRRAAVSCRLRHIHICARQGARLQLQRRPGATPGPCSTSHLSIQPTGLVTTCTVVIACQWQRSVSMYSSRADVATTCRVCPQRCLETAS